MIVYRDEIKIGAARKSVALKIECDVGTSAKEDKAVLLARKAMNMRAKDGGFADGDGFASLRNYKNAVLIPPVGTSVKSVYFLPLTVDGENCDCIVAYCRDGYLYSYALNGANTATRLEGYTFDDSPKALRYCSPTYGDMLILYNEKAMWAYYRNVFRQFVEFTGANDACVYADRIFAIDSDSANRVAFSDLMDEDCWTQGLHKAGSFALETDAGDCLRVFAVGQRLYVLHRYGLSVVDGRGSPEDFTVRTVRLPIGRIMENTAVLMGEKLTVATDRGFYSVDENGYARLWEGALGFGTALNESAAAVGDAYFATFFTNENKRVTFCGNADKTAYLIGLGIERFAKMESELCEGVIGVYNGQILTLTDGASYNGVALEKEFLSAWTDFGDSRKKALNKVCLFADGELVLDVYNENGVRSFEIGGGSGIYAVKPNLKGSVFSFGLRSATVGSRVLKMYVEYTVL